MKRLAFCTVALLAVGLAMLNGCGEKANSNQALLGANLELTGAQASWGQDSKRGIELAVEEINARPEQKIKLKFIFEDNVSRPQDSTNAMKKLVTQDGVLAVIGSVGSSRTIPAADVAMQEKVPLMTHASTNVTITKKGEYVSRICFDDNFQGTVMARFARKSLKADTAAIMIEKGNPYSEGLCAAFKEAFSKDGGKIVAELAYTDGVNDYGSFVDSLKEANPGVVWVPGYHNQVALLIKQAREKGFRPKFLGGDGWDAPELFTLCGPSIAGNFLSNHFDPADPDPKVQEFVAKFKKKFSIDPGAMGALAYDATYAMADAVNRAKALTPEAMKDAINSIKNLQGVCGTITMSPEREVVKNVVVLETTATGYKYKETIKP